MLNFTKKKQEELDFDLTPLIDVIFLLLLFFILTAVTKPSGLFLSLPKTSGQAVSSKYIQIQVQKNGLFFIHKKRVKLQDIHLFLSTLPKAKLILISADKEVSYQYVAQLLDQLKRQGLSHVILETENSVQKTRQEQGNDIRKK